MCLSELVKTAALDNDQPGHISLSLQAPVLECFYTSKVETRTMQGTAKQDKGKSRKKLGLAPAKQQPEYADNITEERYALKCLAGASFLHASHLTKNLIRAFAGTLSARLGASE